MRKGQDMTSGDHAAEGGLQGVSSRLGCGGQDKERARWDEMRRSRRRRRAPLWDQSIPLRTTTRRAAWYWNIKMGIHVRLPPRFDSARQSMTTKFFYVYIIKSLPDLSKNPRFSQLTPNLNTPTPGCSSPLTHPRTSRTHTHLRDVIWSIQLASQIAVY